MKEFIVGDRVELPLTKSVGCPLSSSLVIRRALKEQQNYLYIVSVNPLERSVELHVEEDDLGERFSFEDVKLYNDESPTCEMFKMLIEINEEVQETNKD